MIGIERHDDVVRLEMSSKRSRIAGFTVSAFLVRGVLVDCGFPAVGDEFERALHGERLRGVLITHHHEDHAGNIERVARRGIPIGARPETLALIRSPEPMGYYRRMTWGRPQPLVSPITPFSDDGLQLVQTPGHSDDHVAVWDPSTRTIFAGDLFLGVKVRHARPEEDPRRLVASLERVIALEPLRLFDAHRGLVREPVGALRAKVAWLSATIAAVDALADEGVDERTVTERVLGRPTLSDWYSRGDYAKRMLVQRILATRPAATG